MEQESYIQYLSGYSKEAVDMRDVEVALNALGSMDDEHGAFWVSVIGTNENVLEAHKDLEITAIFEDDIDKSYNLQCTNTQQMAELFDLLLQENFVELKKWFGAL